MAYVIEDYPLYYDAINEKGLGIAGLNFVGNADYKDETDGKIVRQERFYGACSRKFYVGEDVIEEDIQAEFKNGLLKIEIPKKEETIENKNIKHIEIK